MNTQTRSFTANSSSHIPAGDLNLGWHAMPTFKLAEDEVVLGWDAMPAFGKAAKDASNAELVAQFLSETPRPDVQSSDRPSFWCMIGG